MWPGVLLQSLNAASRSASADASSVLLSGALWQPAVQYWRQGGRRVDAGWAQSIATSAASSAGPQNRDSSRGPSEAGGNPRPGGPRQQRGGDRPVQGWDARRGPGGDYPRDDRGPPRGEGRGAGGPRGGGRPGFPGGGGSRPGFPGDGGRPGFPGGGRGGRQQGQAGGLDRPSALDPGQRAGPRGPAPGPTALVPWGAGGRPQPAAGGALAPAHRWDLAAGNAPQRVHQLIGDPRTGVADDTTSNPFGEVTVDMVHHQLSNEVYWFKYEFAAGQLRGAHRDCRLSDYTRNLLYLLRAADPKRWTVSALAAKFRVRRQRVLAILALKELEAQRVEDGRLLSGPLSAYGLRVHLPDLLLHPESGEPLAAPPKGRRLFSPSSAAPDGAGGGSGGSAGATAEDSGAGAGAAVLPAREAHVDRVLPRVVGTAQALQAALLGLLRPHGFNLGALRAALMGDVDAAEQLVRGLLGGGGAAGAAEGQEAADGGAAAADGPLGKELAAHRAAVEGVLAAVERVLGASPTLQEELRCAQMRSAVDAALSAAAPEVQREVAGLPLPGAQPAQATGADAAAAAGGDSEALQALRSQLAAAMGPVLATNTAALHRAFFALPAPARAALLRLLPDVAVRVNAEGVDMARAARDPHYRGPAAATAAAAAAAAAASGKAQGAAAAAPPPSAAAAATAAGRATRLAVDAVFGFQPVPEPQLQGLERALDALAASGAALQAAVEALDPHGLLGKKGVPSLALGAPTSAAPPASGTPSPSPSPSPAASHAMTAEELRTLRGLAAQYLSAEALWADVAPRGLGVLGRAGARTGKGLGADGIRRVLRLMAEADPDSLRRLRDVEAVALARRRRDFATADKIARGSAAHTLALERQAAAAAAAQGAAEGQEGQQAGEQQEGSAARGGTAAWDMLAAWLDVRAAGRVYGRGSGERHVTRLPSYPAFEGYSLQEFDSAREGELSALNRLVAERTEEQMYDRFRSDLLYNLGVRGEKLRDPPPGGLAWPANLDSRLVRPMVVYGISPDGTTQQPPLYVATPDGGRRPLNEQEQVYQERRLPRPRLPYYMGRIKRMTEL